MLRQHFHMLHYGFSPESYRAILLWLWQGCVRGWWQSTNEIDGRTTDGPKPNGWDNGGENPALHYNAFKRSQHYCASIQQSLPRNIHDMIYYKFQRFYQFSIYPSLLYTVVPIIPTNLFCSFCIAMTPEVANDTQNVTLDAVPTILCRVIVRT